MRTLFATALLTVIIGIYAGSSAIAHHGWAWTTGGNIDLTGIVKSAKLGNPHGILKIAVEAEEWTAEVGQPWRNERAGLKPEDFAVGNEVRIIGEPSANIEDRRVKAERVYIAGREYVLYPDRD